jgi:predicted transcriptional regulator
VALLSITEAAEQWGITRPTIYRYIKAGKLSRRADKKIDTAELLRVLGEPDVKPSVKAADAEALQLQVEQLRQQVEQLQQERAKAEEREEWLKGQVEAAQQTIKLLEHQRPAPAPTPPATSQQARPRLGLLGRLIGAVIDE